MLAAIESVPRHEFVPAELEGEAWDDRALPLPLGQSISQPFVVAAMTEALRLIGGERVLEIGAGSGYQAAILARCAKSVLTLEVVPELALGARATLARLGIDSVEVVVGDGWRGAPERAPFDAILVAAAPLRVPEMLVQQLAPSGRMVLPLGASNQMLIAIERTPSGLVQRELFPVRFVPMIEAN